MHGPHAKSSISSTSMDLLKSFMRSILYVDLIDFLGKSIQALERQDLAFGSIIRDNLALKQDTKIMQSCFKC